MSAQEQVATQPKWVIPVLVLGLTALTFIALTFWAKAVFGGFAPGAGGMLGPVGMRAYISNGPTGGRMGGMPAMENMTKMHQQMENSPQHQKMHQNCSKTMKGRGIDHNQMYQEMHGPNTNKTL